MACVRRHDNSQVCALTSNLLWIISKTIRWNIENAMDSYHFCMESIGMLRVGLGGGDRTWISFGAEHVERRQAGIDVGHDGCVSGWGDMFWHGDVTCFNVN